MLRIIARLDIKNGAVIKGIHLEGQRKIGDPIEIANLYYQQGIDEILFMDSVASLYSRPNLFHMIADACKKVFVPITMGGGINSIAHVEEALRSGADKVAINTAFVRYPDFVNQLVSVYGSQSIIGSIEAKKNPKGWQVYINNGREPTGLDVFEWAKELEERGVGELLVTSIDQEGTQRGFDILLYEKLEKIINIPIVACGGAGKMRDINDVIQKVCINGIAISSVLHYAKLSIPEINKFLKNLDIC